MVFSSEVVFHIGALISRQPQMTFKSSIAFGKDINVSRTPGTGVQAVLHIGKWMRFNRLTNLLVQNEMHVGKDMPFQRDNWMMVDAFVLMGLRLYARAIINTTIPPGGELRINSDAFTAMLGQENALHRYEGDWIHFDRNTTELIVHTGTNVPMEGSVLYNWRFV